VTLLHVLQPEDDGCQARMKPCWVADLQLASQTAESSGTSFVYKMDVSSPISQVSAMLSLPVSKRNIVRVCKPERNHTFKSTPRDLHVLQINGCGVHENGVNGDVVNSNGANGHEVVGNGVRAYRTLR
jgi:hypothetical protein